VKNAGTENEEMPDVVRVADVVKLSWNKTLGKAKNVNKDSEDVTESHP
jgi:hypothetical protein